MVVSGQMDGRITRTGGAIYNTNQMHHIFSFTSMWVCPCVFGTGLLLQIFLRSSDGSPLSSSCCS